MVGRIIYMTLGKASRSTQPPCAVQGAHFASPEPGGCIAQGIDPREIMGVTFTKKAAAELKERVAARGVRDVKVTTFHSFCYDVLKRFHREAGFPTVPLIWSNDNELQAVMAEAMRWATAAVPRLPAGARSRPSGLLLVQDCLAAQRAGAVGGLVAPSRVSVPRSHGQGDDQAGRGDPVPGRVPQVETPHPARRPLIRSLAGVQQ